MTRVTERDSNIEALRLLSMFLIMAVHANYGAIGVPTPEEACQTPLTAFTRILIEQICVVAVNVFVMISGWFGIRATLKGIANILFQVCFYSVAVTAAWLIATGESISLSVAYESLYPGGCYWFIPAYLILYVLSKPLNAFVTSATGKELLTFCLCYFALELLYGMFNNSGGFSRGYSALSFIGLYVFARYLRLYGGFLTGFRPAVYFLTFLGVTLLCSIPTFICQHLGFQTSLGLIFYLSPNVIFCAACLLVGFSRLKFKSRTVNRLAASCLAIYLIHEHPLARPYYQSFIRYLYETFHGPLCLLVIGICLTGIGLACLLTDRIRLAAWNAICSTTKRVQNHTETGQLPPDKSK